jgi:hypothetical protein
MMKAAVLMLCLLAGAASLLAQAGAKDPLEFYKGYLAVLAKAKTLDELVPFYVKSLGDGLKKMPREMQGNYLKMNARSLSDVQVVKQTVTATRADYQLTAKTPSGAVTTGGATLVKEGGAWKVENEAWASQVP